MGAIPLFQRCQDLVRIEAFGFRKPQGIDITLFHVLGRLPEPNFTHRCAEEALSVAGHRTAARSVGAGARSVVDFGPFVPWGDRFMPFVEHQFERLLRSSPNKRLRARSDSPPRILRCMTGVFELSP